MLLVPAALLSASAMAQVQPVDPRYAGSYVFAGSIDEVQDQYRRALAPEIARIDPLLRMVGEAQLEGRLPLPRRIGIRLDGDRIRIELRHDRQSPRVYESRAGYPSRGGRRSTMTQLFRDGHLEQIVDYGRGNRRYRVFELDASGARMTFSQMFDAGDPPRPLRFTAPYRRVR